jgi:hypothetical protein
MRKAQKGLKMNPEATTETAATDAAQGASGAPEKATSKKAASRKKGVPKGQKAANGANSKAKAKQHCKAANKPAKTGKAATPRGESKGAKILELIARPKGATLAELMKATDWQALSVRGFLSTASKKQGLKIESEKNEGGDRLYRVKSNYPPTRFSRRRSETGGVFPFLCDSVSTVWRLSFAHVRVARHV